MPRRGFDSGVTFMLRRSSDGGVTCTVAELKVGASARLLRLDSQYGERQQQTLGVDGYS